MQAPSPRLHIALWQPEIPPNTGNVARLAAALDLPLHLIGPLGFVLSDRRVRRAGLDYWDGVQLSRHANPEEFWRHHADSPAWYFTTRATRSFWEVAYQPGDFLFFGAESCGLPADLLEAHPERCVRIPHGTGVRSLNLANCVSIAVYEALRQFQARGLGGP